MCPSRPEQSSLRAAAGIGASTQSGQEARRIAELIASQFGNLLSPHAPPWTHPLELLRTWRDRLDGILQVVTDGVLVLDFTAAVAYANAPALEALEVREAAVPWGRPLATLLTGLELRSENGAPMPVAQFPGLWPFQGHPAPDTLVRVARPGGPERWLLVRTWPLVDEQQRVAAVTVVLRDATLQKQSELRLQLLADASAELGRSLDEADTARAISALIVERLADGCAIQLLRDGRLEQTEIACAHPADAVPFSSLLRRWTHDGPGSGPSSVLESRDAELHESFDIPPVALVDALRPSSAIVAPLCVGERRLGVLSVFTTLRPRFGPQELVLVSELAQRLAMALENARLFRESVEQLKRKDLFLALVGHELRNPLAPIVTALEHLAKLDGPHATKLAMMRRQAKQLGRLLDDLLDLSRIDRGKLELVPSTVKVADVVRQALEAVQPLVDAQGHRLELSVPEELTVEADPTRLSQVLSNLLHNAAKFTPPDGRIAVRAHASGDEVELAVIDNGQGIALERPEQLFEPYVQGEQRAFGQGGGLGLGLNLVRELVRLHEGSISIHSDGPGRGTEFRVRLPARFRQSPAS